MQNNWKDNDAVTASERRASELNATHTVEEITEQRDVYDVEVRP